MVLSTTLKLYTYTLSVYTHKHIHVLTNTDVSIKVSYQNGKKHGDAFHLMLFRMKWLVRSGERTAIFTIITRGILYS